MADEQAVDDIAAVARGPLDLGRGVDEVSPVLIRYWCEAFEDANASYLGGVDGSRTGVAVVAPSLLAASVSRRPWWPVAEGSNQFGLIEEIGDQLDCSE